MAVAAAAPAEAALACIVQPAMNAKGGAAGVSACRWLGGDPVCVADATRTVR